MIKPPAYLPVVDNSGALIGGCINIPKTNSRKGATPSCLITISVKKNVFKKNIVKKSRIISKGQLVKSLVLTASKEVRRIGHFQIKGTLNNIILLNQYYLPFGSRVFGVVFREIRTKSTYRKAVS